MDSTAPSSQLRAIPDGEGVWRIDCAIAGMTCGLCSLTLEEALARVPDVSSVSINPASHAGVILLTDPEGVFSVQRCIESLGYGVAGTGSHTALDYARQQSRWLLWRTLVAALCMMQIMMYSAPEYVFSPDELGHDSVTLMRWAQWMLSIVLMVFCAKPVLAQAWKGLRYGSVQMDLPAAIALITTFAVSSARVWTGQGEVWFDSLAMFLTFLLLARYIESLGRERAVRHLHQLNNDVPQEVSKLASPDNQAAGIITVAATELQPGDVIRIPVGQGIATDGVVIRGRSMVDESMLTGESELVAKGPGDAVWSGSINHVASVEVQVTAVGKDSSMGRLGQWIQSALSEKPLMHATVSRWAPYVLWGTLLTSALCGAVWWQFSPDRAMLIAITVLIVTCPCALSIAAPSALQAAVMNLAKQGVIIRHPQALEILPRITHAMFDKTGTLTARHLPLQWSVISQTFDLVMQACKAEPLGLYQAIRLVAEQSHHPKARSLGAALSAHLLAAGETLAAHSEPPVCVACEEVTGQGIQADVRLNGHALRLRIGRADFCGQPFDDEKDLFVACMRPASGDESDPRWLMLLTATSECSADPQSADTVQYFKNKSIACEVLSGDEEKPTVTLANRIGMDRSLARQSPEQKLLHVRDAQRQGSVVMMVGDGLNDAAVLSQADVSVAMPDGSQLTAQQADILVLKGGIAKVAYVHAVALKTRRVMHQNLVWAVAYNLICVPLAAMGMMPPWLAGLGMAMSSIVVVLNASRLAWVREGRST